MELINDNKNNIELRIVNLLVEEIKNILKAEDKVIIGIPGGRSVSGIFEKLNQFNLPWNKIKFFLVDERVVDINDDLSNYKLAKEYLKKADNVGNIYSYDYQKPASSYEEDFMKIAKHHDDESRFDIIILSSGEDGHVASLYPDHDSIENNHLGYISLTDSPKPPPNRISASRNLLLTANLVFLLFLGDAKKDALHKFLDNKVSVKNCPAKLVANMPSYVFTDIQ